MTKSVFYQVNRQWGKTTQTSPLKLAPWGQTPPFIDTEWGALKKAYKMDGHQEFAWIHNGRAQSEP